MSYSLWSSFTWAAGNRNESWTPLIPFLGGFFDGDDDDFDNFRDADIQESDFVPGKCL